jgi:hypothetical protein
MKRGHDPKTMLTPNEKLRAAFGHLCLGIAQHDIAALFGINAGRIAEAVNEIAQVTGHKTARKEEDEE